MTADLDLTNLDLLLVDRDDLGPCCVCEGPTAVCHIQMLPWKAVVPGHGWGCVVCGLPQDGAIAVICDACTDQPLRFACRGTPSDDGRVPVLALSEPFIHDEQVHALAAAEAWGSVQ